MYKFSVKLFKFLNKHLYILSFISLIAKFRKSNSYKVISWVIKIIVSLNILLASGLFLSITDLQTPFDAIFNLYSEFLKPYIDLIKSKINNILKSINNVDDEFIKQYRANKPIINQPVIPLQEEVINKTLQEDELPSLNAKDLAFFTSVCFFAYFLFYLPGFGDATAIDLNQYNYINQSLIEVKMIAKDVIINWLFGGNNGGDSAAVNPPADVKPVAGPSNIERTSSVDSVASDATVSQSTNYPSTSTSNSNLVSTNIQLNNPLPVGTYSSPDGRLSAIITPQPVTLEDFATPNSDWLSPAISEGVLSAESVVNTVDIGTQTGTQLLDVATQTDASKLIIKRLNSIGVQTELSAMEISKLMVLLGEFSDALPADTKSILLKSTQLLPINITD